MTQRLYRRAGGGGEPGPRVVPCVPWFLWAAFDIIETGGQPFLTPGVGTPVAVCVRERERESGREEDQ